VGDHAIVTVSTLVLPEEMRTITVAADDYRSIDFPALVEVPFPRERVSKLGAGERLLGLNHALWRRWRRIRRFGDQIGYAQVDYKPSKRDHIVGYWKHRQHEQEETVEDSLDEEEEGPIDSQEDSHSFSFFVRL